MLGKSPAMLALAACAATSLGVIAGTTAVIAATKDCALPRTVLELPPTKDRPRPGEGDLIRLRGVRVVFTGNSITLHNPAPGIGWTNDWGMAASARERDYVHLVTAAIEGRDGRRADVMVRNLYEFERNFETYDLSRIDDLVAFDPDCLISDCKGWRQQRTQRMSQDERGK